VAAELRRPCRLELELEQEIGIPAEVRPVSGGFYEQSRAIAADAEEEQARHGLGAATGGGGFGEGGQASGLSLLRVGLQAHQPADEPGLGA